MPGSAYGRNPTSGSGAVSSVSAGDVSLVISPTTGAVVAKVGELSGTNATLGAKSFLISGLTSGQILQYNGTNWVNAAAGAGTISDITSTGGTIALTGATGPTTNVDINLTHANYWTGAQTFKSSDLLVNNPAATFAYTIAGAAIVAAQTLTLPLTTGADTLAALGTVQTWAAAQTFPSSDLLINNPAGTFHYTIVGAALAASYTLTLPLLTAGDTVAVLGFAQTWTAAQTFKSADFLLQNPAATFSYTIQSAAITAARTITLPLLTSNDTMAVLGFAQTFSAIQTFSAVPVIKTSSASLATLYNSAGTFYATLTAPAYTGNYTLTLPLQTGADTLAALGVAQTWNAVQTFGTNISLMGAQLSGSLTSGYYLQYNGTNWVCAAGGSFTFNANLVPTADNSYNVGSAAYRVLQYFSGPSGFSVFAAAADANPLVSLYEDTNYSSGAVAFGPGGGSSFDTWLTRTGANTLAILASAGGAKTIAFVSNTGQVSQYNSRATAGQGVIPIYSIANQTAVTGTETNIINAFTPPSTAGLWEVVVECDINTATSGVIQFLVSYTDSNGNAVAGSAGYISIYQLGTAAPALSFTTSTASRYYGTATIAINNAGASITVGFNGSGTLAGKASAVLRQLI